MGASDVLLVILAILLPPVAVFIRRGCGVDLVINILLTLCGHIPGAIHALYLVLHDRKRRRHPQAMHSAPPQQQTHPTYYDQPRAMTPEPAPPTYGDHTKAKGEKQEYGI
jgi:uncharacterized membrane protein YqaE (UPF0057 family)